MVMNNVPHLTQGMHIAEKPQGIEALCGCRHSQWQGVIEALKVIDATKCVEIDVTGATKSRINTIKTGIKYWAKKLNYKPFIKFARKQDMVYVWSNR